LHDVKIALQLASPDWRKESEHLYTGIYSPLRHLLVVVNTKGSSTLVIFILLFNNSQFILCIDKHVGYSCRKSKVASDEICK
jgi:hypothetical protein